MRSTATSRWLIALSFVALAFAGCTTDRPRSAQAEIASDTAPVTILVFGDSGYHYDYLEAEDYENIVSEQQFIAKERLDWIEDKRPIEELAYPPMYRLPRNGSMVAASGLEPVSRVMKTYCTSEVGCDLAVMLGDNIYPDGATGSLDGRDAQRFHDLFIEPFAGLAAGREDFAIYSVLGNHDWRTSRAGAMAQVRFLETTPPFYMDGIFYRVQPASARGQVEIFAIDTEVLLASTTVYKAQLGDDARELKSERIEKPLAWTVPQSEAERTMVRWLEDALRNSTARWKIVLGHHPLWSTSGSKFEQARALRALILPTLCRYADLYLAGHEHTLEVHTDDCSAAQINGTVAPLPQVVSGAASKMRPTNTAFIRHQLAEHPELRTLYATGLTWGFSHLTIEGDSLTVRIIETPADGSGLTRITFENSFVRRNQRTGNL